jgi:protein involved in polysaccharide export with SLBB domain
VDLFRMDDLRLKYTVKVLGPFTHPGSFAWHDGMRAADLIFAAGIPKLNADRYYAELAHLDPAGRPSPAIRLDLSRLLYSVDQPAPGLDDPAVNVALKPFDQITLYELPDFKVHHTVNITGQVRRPGPYVLTDEHFTLRQLIERSGGLTGEAMPRGGIFLRRSLREKDLSEADLKRAGLKDPDPTAHGINEILQRLSETKRSKDGGALLASPVLHGLLDGSTNRLVVDFDAALHGDPSRDVELMDGDQIIIPRRVENAYVVGEVASPFATYRVRPGDSVKDLVRLAGGFTRKADPGELRLLKADGRVLDRRVMGQTVENLQALTPLALILNAIRR